jgi:hypothetical protein
MNACSIRSLALFALLAAPAGAGVLTVAADGSGDFTSINSAVLAAADGDTLVVRPGSYGAFTVGGTKSLSILSDGTGLVQVNGPIGVLNGAAGRTFVFSGLTSTGLVGSGTSFQGFGFWAVNSAASVRVQDCSFTGAAGDPEGWELDTSSWTVEVTGHAAGWAGVWLEDCSGSIAFNDCAIVGGGGTDMTTFSIGDCGCSYGQPGGDAVRVENCVVALADCDTKGGVGCAADRQGGVGGSGLWVQSGTAIVSGGTWEGAAGGGAWDYIGSVFGGSGGDGIHAAPGATVWVRDALALGGAGGGSLSGDIGAPGSPVDGSAALFAGHARSLSVGNPALVGGTLSVTLTGQPGDVAMLFVSATTGVLPSLKFGGSLLVGSALTLPLGVLPGSGQLVLTSPVPAIAPLLELPVFLQGLAGVPGDAAFTGAATIVLVDPAAL